MVKKSKSMDLGFLYFLSLVFCVFFGVETTYASSSSETTEITLLHTNDLHSHFRSEGGPLGLGGLARLKTVITRARNANPHTILVDGGDWSEGNIYYTEGAGLESIRMLGRLGYDVAVVGNHDWLNGPDNLLNTIEQSLVKTQFVSANLNVDEYKRSEEFKKWILPYVIREINGRKIALVGLSTYERIYDSYLVPVKITDPAQVIQEIASELKNPYRSQDRDGSQERVDAVVAISHNDIHANEEILKKAPDVDLIIGAHDHVKLTHPVIVERSGAHAGWVVETGKWGRYLGQVKMRIGPQGVELVDYHLTQVDRSIPEDPEIAQIIHRLDARLEGRFGKSLHESIGRSEEEASHEGNESLMGNLVTDAYLDSTQADFTMESLKFISGEFHVGNLRLVDAFNALPAVYQPSTQKSWTLKKLKITGRRLKWMLYLLYATHKLSSIGSVHFSGIHFTYDPWFWMMQNESVEDLNTLFQAEMEQDPYRWFGLPQPHFNTLAVVKNITIQGQPLEESDTYVLGLNEGIVQAFRFMNSYISDVIPLDSLEDTGNEAWRVLARYIQKISPLNEKSVILGNRVQTKQADLSVHEGDIEWIPSERKIKVLVKNEGASSSSAGGSLSGPTIHLLKNKNGSNESVDPDYEELVTAQPIPELGSQESHLFTFELSASALSDFKKSGIMTEGWVPLTIQVEGDPAELNTRNNQVTRWVDSAQF